MLHTHQSCCQKKSNCSVKFRPLESRVLVQRLEQEQKLKGGILLPETAKKKQEQALVVAVGPGKKDKNGQLIVMPVKVGDTILMEKYSGQEITLEDQDYVVLKAEDIIAIIEK